MSDTSYSNLLPMPANVPDTFTTTQGTAGQGGISVSAPSSFAPSSGSGGSSISGSSTLSKVGTALENTATGILNPAAAVINAASSLFGGGSVWSLLGIGGSSGYTWGQLFGNLGLILLGIMLIGISLTVGTRTTIVQIGKSALK